MAGNSMLCDPEMHGAPPVKGNFTTDASGHLWCAAALLHVVANDEAFGMWNDDIQAALRWLLTCEIERAKAAKAAEARRP